MFHEDWRGGFPKAAGGLRTGYAYWIYVYVYVCILEKLRTTCFCFTEIPEFSEQKSLNASDGVGAIGVGYGGEGRKLSQTELGRGRR